MRTASNLRSNLYVLGIAESGGGKDHARKVIKEVLFQAGFADHLGGERIASDAVDRGSAVLRHKQAIITADPAPEIETLAPENVDAMQPCDRALPHHPAT